MAGRAAELDKLFGVDATETSRKVATTGAAPVAVRPGVGVSLSRLPEAFRKDGRIRLGVRGTGLTRLLSVHNRRHRGVRRRHAASGAVHSRGGSAPAARYGRGDVEIQLQ